MSDAKSIVILSGPVGAGKSTVAAALIDASPAPLAYIEGDEFWSFIKKTTAGRIKSGEFKMVMRAMLSAATHYSTAGYETILDFSVPPWFLSTARAVAKFKDVPLDYVVLLPSEPLCAARAAARTEGAIDDYTHYHELYQEFADARDDYAPITDDTDDPVSLAVRIRAGLDTGAFRLPSA